MGRMTRNAWPNSSKWPPNVSKKNVKLFSKAVTANKVARITTLKLRRNLASQTAKNASISSRKWQPNVSKKNAKTTTPKLPRSLASQMTKNASTNSKKWLQNALKKNAMQTPLMTNAKINARITTK